MRPKPYRQWQGARQRRALETELCSAWAALRANDAAFQQAEEPWYTEQVIYEHAALLCRCSALLRQLREGDAP